jgi:voltage-gated sodium channel
MSAHAAGAEPDWARVCRRIADSRLFQRVMLWIIVFAALLAGLETYPRILASHGEFLRALDNLVIALFTVEIIIRLAAYGRQPWRFFLDGWNVFDFLIVVLCLLPIGAEQAAAARLVRLLRVFRLFSGVPRLRLIVSAMVQAIPSIGYVALLLFLLFYVYGILGTTLFRTNDPVHFGDLHTTMLSLLRTVTLEDWTDLMYIQIYGSDVYGYERAALKLTAEQRELWTPRAMPVVGALYFVTFVLIGTMIVLNLFVGVVLSSLNDAQAAQARETILRRQSETDLDGQLELLETRLDELHRHVRQLRGGPPPTDST